MTNSYKPKTQKYTAEKPYKEDINDLVEKNATERKQIGDADENSVEKGRGPDKQQRKPRGEAHNGEYGFQTHGNLNPEAAAKNKAESNAKFDQAVAADKKRRESKKD